MMNRREQVRSDAEAVLTRRTESLTPLANGHLFISGGTGFLGAWLLELIAILNARHREEEQARSRHSRQFVRF